MWSHLTHRDTLVSCPSSPSHSKSSFTVVFQITPFILDWWRIVLYPTFPVANGVALSWCLAGSALQAAKWLQDVCMFLKINGRSPDHALKTIIILIIFSFRDHVWLSKSSYRLEYRNSSFLSNVDNALEYSEWHDSGIYIEGYRFCLKWKWKLSVSRSYEVYLCASCAIVSHLWNPC